jgi:uncharacterized protein
MDTDTDSVLACVIAGCTTNVGGIHGQRHWEKVERIGSIIAARNGANLEVVRLFSVLHDSQRLNDGTDRGHGARASEFAASLRSQNLFDLSGEDFEKLAFACAHHTDGELSDDPTIGCCWDADRLDLMRVGTLPRPEYMSTVVGRGAAADLSDKAPSPGEGPKRYQGPLYTIDSRGGLSPGLKFVPATSSDAAGLYGGGLLVNATLTRTILERYSDPSQGRLELVLETVRRLHFRHFPSRQVCLYACDSIESLKKVSVITNRNINGTAGIHGRIFELTGQSFGCFDGFTMYLRRGNPWDRAMSYWSGNRTSDPAGSYYEYIVGAPIEIGRQVGTI